MWSLSFAECILLKFIKNWMQCYEENPSETAGSWMFSISKRIQKWVQRQLSQRHFRWLDLKTLFFWWSFYLRCDHLILREELCPVFWDTLMTISTLVCRRLPRWQTRKHIALCITYSKFKTTLTYWMSLACTCLDLLAVVHSKGQWSTSNAMLG